MDIYNEEDTDLAVMFEYGYEKGRASLQAENKRLREALARVARTRPELSQEKAHDQLVWVIGFVRDMLKEMNDAN